MIWCVDDDDAIRDIEVYALKSTGYEAEGFSCAADMFSALAEKLPQLVILDIMMPGEDGIGVLRRLRGDPKTKNIPVIMATAKGTEMDTIEALDLGADDYLIKPFGVMEMISRVKAVLRRCNPAEENAVLTAGKIVLSETERTVAVNGEKTALTYKEFELLRLFMKHKGTVFSRERLLSEVWGTDYFGETRTVDMHIKTLRKKLGECGKYIETVINVGYRFVVGGD